MKTKCVPGNDIPPTPEVKTEQISCGQAEECVLDKDNGIYQCVCQEGYEQTPQGCTPIGLYVGFWIGYKDQSLNVL